MAESVSLYSLLVSHDYVILWILVPCAVGNDCHPLIKKEISKHFANCELRSMVIVDKSMSESDPPTTNYPGKIPPGHDAHSDVVDEKN
ncbi:hypothetical protein CsSME_00005192 [Camellia sinensis var. sinensis]